MYSRPTLRGQALGSYSVHESQRSIGGGPRPPSSRWAPVRRPAPVRSIPPAIVTLLAQRTALTGSHPSVLIEPQADEGERRRGGEQPCATDDEEQRGEHRRHDQA